MYSETRDSEKVALDVLSVLLSTFHGVLRVGVQYAFMCPVSTIDLKQCN